MKVRSKTLLSIVLCSVCFLSSLPAAAQIAVRHTEGLVHGFLVLRSAEGEPLAHGELFQGARGNRVTARLVFHFKDGSVHDETAVYSQLRTFQLQRYHLVQKGPSFPHPEDVSVDVPTGQVKVQYTDNDGKQQVSTEHMKLLPDLANGMTLTLLKNLPPGTAEAKASMLVFAPKPRIVKLAITPQGEDTFQLGWEKRKATHYVMKIELGGVAGVVAPIVGKQPPDINAWILSGDAPAFVKSSGPLYAGGPIWQIELESPVWAH